MLTFYKRPDVRWARPWSVRLRGVYSLRLRSLVPPEERRRLLECSPLSPAKAQYAVQKIILEKTIWSAPDSDEDMDYQLEDSCRVTGFLRQYIEHVKYTFTYFDRYITGVEETGSVLGGLDLTSTASLWKFPEVSRCQLRIQCVQNY
ncbi:hypothetical protein MHYP_G00274160 [Metynnis hypsauchen]